MKKVFYLLGISTLFLVASCDSENITESIPEAKTYAPKVQGVFGNLADTNPTTKAGVIEDNPNFRTEGEYFYWHVGDEALLLFFDNNNPGADPVPLIYTAVDVNADEPKNAEFTTTGEIDLGNYTVYALYPADSWDLVDGLWTAELTPPGPVSNDGSSAYLGQNMLMKAKAENVVIGDDGPNTIDLSYQHLGGVIRFHIRNSDSDHPRLTQFDLAKVIEGEEVPVPFFPGAAYLDDLDSDTLVPLPGALLSEVSVEIDDASDGLDFDFFLPILSIAGFEESASLGLRAIFEDGSSYTRLLTSDDIPFLEQGFEAGLSYYFSLTNWVATPGSEPEP